MNYLIHGSIFTFWAGMMIQLLNHEIDFTHENFQKQDLSVIDEIQNRAFEISVGGKPFCIFEIDASQKANATRLYHIRSRLNVKWYDEILDPLLKGYLLVGSKQEPLRLNLTVSYHQDEYKILGIPRNGRFEISFVDAHQASKTIAIPYGGELQKIVLALPFLSQRGSHMIHLIKALQFKEIKGSYIFETYPLEYPSTDAIWDAFKNVQA